MLQWRTCSLISFCLLRRDGVRGYRPRFLMSALETTGSEADPLWLNRWHDFPPTADLQLTVPRGVFSPVSSLSFHLWFVLQVFYHPPTPQQQHQQTLPHQVGDVSVFFTWIMFLCCYVQHSVTAVVVFKVLSWVEFHALAIIPLSLKCAERIVDPHRLKVLRRCFSPRQ